MSKFPKVEVSQRGQEAQESLAHTKDLTEAQKIIRARLEGDPYALRVAPSIKLKDAGKVCRWFNSDKRPDHIWRAKNVLGWVSVKRADLADPEQIGPMEVNAAGEVTRGEHGREVLMQMDKDAYEQIQKAKVQKSDATFGSSKRTKQDIVDRAGAELGAQAAEWLEKHTIGEVTDGVETVVSSE